MKSTIFCAAICVAVLSTTGVANAGYYGNKSAGVKADTTGNYKRAAHKAKSGHHPTYKYKWEKKTNKWHAKHGKWHKKRKQWREHGPKKRKQDWTSKPYKPYKPKQWVERPRKNKYKNKY